MNEPTPCPHCRTPLPPASRFCAACGTASPAPPTPHNPATGTTTSSHKSLLLLISISALVAALTAGIAFGLWKASNSILNDKADSTSPLPPGYTQVILIPTPTSANRSITQDDIQAATDIVTQRVNALDTPGSSVTLEGEGESSRVVVRVPGVSAERLADLVGRRAALEFRPLWYIAGPAPEADAPPTSPKAPVHAPTLTPSLEQNIAALDCLTATNQEGGTTVPGAEWLGTCDTEGAAKYTLQPAFIEGTHITDALAQLPQQGVGGWVVSITFDTDGAQRLTDASQEIYSLPECNPGGSSPCNAFAIVLDGVVISAPRFNEPITGGKAQIDGNFTAQEAQDLANLLSYGALPVAFDIESTTTG